MINSVEKVLGINWLCTRLLKPSPKRCCFINNVNDKSWNNANDKSWNNGMIKVYPM